MQIRWLPGPDCLQPVEPAQVRDLVVGVWVEHQRRDDALLVRPDPEMQWSMDACASA